MLRFHFPLIEPDVQISRIRLSDGLHRQARGCFMQPSPASTALSARPSREMGLVRPCGQSPGSLCIHCLPEVRSLPSTDITRFSGTRNLSDSPNGPACLSRASGWAHTPTAGVSRVAFVLLVQTCRRHYPGGTAGEIRLLPWNQRRRPSPILGWVGSHIFRFGACSAFTHVTACLLAEPLTGPFHRRLRQLRYLRYRSDCYWLEQQLPGGNYTHGRTTPLHGAPKMPIFRICQEP
jgi:hypothetical protein